MTSAEASRLKRSYERNLNWCRFWLGVSLAVATLTFTFAVDKVFDLSSERVSTSTDVQNSSAKNNPSESISFANVAVMLMLVGISGLCVALSALFRVLFRIDDAMLAAFEHPLQEATT